MLTFLFWVFMLGLVAWCVREIIEHKEWKRKIDDIERHANDKHDR